jgi:dihydropteroate synthase
MRRERPLSTPGRGLSNGRVTASSQQAPGRGTAPDLGRGFADVLRRRSGGGAASPPLVMGIINVTPDSFSDGGLFLAADAAIAQGLKLAREGAAILDIGGESTRKGATPVSAEEELRRVIPVIEALKGAGALISIDTMKPAVAEAAFKAGAVIVNDVRGLQGDPGIATIAAAYRAGVIAMHNPGLLGSAIPIDGDPIDACLGYFERSIAIARRAGIAKDRLVLDPGFGFGKSPEQNLAILARFSELHQAGFPLLAGTSRKSFIGRVTGRGAPDRLVATLATNVIAALAGAAIIRVHDVAEHVEAMTMVAAIRAAGAASKPASE